MMTRQRRKTSGRSRQGAAALDYVLVLGTALPMTAMIYYFGTKMVRLVYEVTCVLISWPFM